jgi:hypothetical protein
MCRIKKRGYFLYEQTPETKMTRLHFRLTALLPLITIVLLMMCGVKPAPAPVAFTAVGPFSTTPKKAAVAANELAQSKWVATLEDGCKPGCGYELLVDNDHVSRGRFYLLDPNKPHDLAGAGQSVPFQEMKQAGRTLTFSFTLDSAQGKHREHRMINLDAPLVGEVGKKVIAKIRADGTDAQAEELTFVRAR